MPGTVDESELVRARGIVRDKWIILLVFFDICNYCVAQAERFEELLQFIMILVARLADVLIKLRIIEVDVRDTGWIFFLPRLIGSVVEVAS